MPHVAILALHLASLYLCTSVYLEVYIHMYMFLYLNCVVLVDSNGSAV